MKLINKLMLSEEYYRSLSDQQMHEIRLLEFQTQAFDKRVKLYEESNRAYKEKVDTLNANLSNLSFDVQNLNNKVRNKNHFIIGATIVAILEGALIYLLTK